MVTERETTALTISKATTEIEMAAEKNNWSDVKCELVYYESRGLVEPIRYMLARAGVSFTDTRTPITQFPTVLPPEIKQKCPFGTVPLLYWNGKQLSQSNTISRFLARKFGLAGADEWEAAKCDELADAARDFYDAWMPLYFEKDAAKKQQLKEKATATSRQRFLSAFQGILEKRAESGAKGTFLVGDGLTWADIYVAHYIDQSQRIFGADFNLEQDFPLVHALVKGVFEDDGIKEWIERRPSSVY